jgi:hypothetical protein
MRRDTLCIDAKALVDQLIDGMGLRGAGGRLGVWTLESRGAGSVNILCSKAGSVEALSRLHLKSRAALRAPRGGYLADCPMRVFRGGFLEGDFAAGSKTNVFFVAGGLGGEFASGAADRQRCAREIPCCRSARRQATTVRDVLPPSSPRCRPRRGGQGGEKVRESEAASPRTYPAPTRTRARERSAPSGSETCTCPLTLAAAP